MSTKTVSGIVLTGVICLALSIFLAVPTTQAESDRHSDHEEVRYPTIGSELDTLPAASLSVQVNNKNYRYDSGSFYTGDQESAYTVVQAPIGARVPALPVSYARFGIGSRHYFYANKVYYLWSSDRKEYIVVEKPLGAEVAMDSSSADSPV